MFRRIRRNKEETDKIFKESLPILASSVLPWILLSYVRSDKMIVSFVMTGTFDSFSLLQSTWTGDKRLTIINEIINL